MARAVQAPAPDEPPLMPGERVLVEATVAESYAGDTCVRIEVGTKGGLTSVWATTRRVHRDDTGR